jgi:hypothetical protein
METKISEIREFFESSAASHWYGQKLSIVVLGVGTIAYLNP